MATSSQDTYLIVTAFSDNTLDVIEIAATKNNEKQLHIDRLDTDLLTQFDKLGYQDISGIAVNLSKLGGFASSRLIVSTLNTLCWLRNIPLQPIDGRSYEDIAVALKEAHGFDRPLVPNYKAPPDITPSKKKPEFTIES